MLKTSESSLLAAKTPAEFARIAGTVLSRAQDKHLWFEVGDEMIPSYVHPQVPNANYSLLPKLVPNVKKRGRAVVSGRWDDDIGYLAIATWDRARLEDGKPIFDALDALRDSKALIIDVRMNGGGAEPLAQELAGCFISERQLYGKHVYRDPKSSGGFTRPRERWLEPNPNRPHYQGRVVVLSGPVVMSSCESFLLMMKQVPGTMVVGAASQGSSGNPKPYDLKNGVTVYLPSWKDMTRNWKASACRRISKSRRPRPTSKRRIQSLRRRSPTYGAQAINKNTLNRGTGQTAAANWRSRRTNSPDSTL